MSPQTSEPARVKARRLLLTGQLAPMTVGLYGFVVRGDTDSYVTVVSADGSYRLCTCRHGREQMADPTVGDCSHIQAAVLWINAPRTPR